VGDEVIRWAVGVGVRPQELLMLVVAVLVMLVFDRVMNRRCWARPCGPWPTTAQSPA
jgi:hypothetical protein